MTELSTYLEFARDAAAVGARIALGHYGRDPKRERKSDGTWVTEADWAVEAQIRLRIARTWPDHNVLGEEEGLTSAGGGPPVTGAPTWIIDPIDGTHNYMAGIPMWATLVGLRIDETNVVGVAHAPAIDETYYAALEAGAFFHDRRIQVEPVGDLADATVLYAGAGALFHVGLEGFYKELVNRAWRSRGFGDFWGHMLVARGAAHVMVEPEVAIWDIAALEPIVTEAGGRLTHLDGAAWGGTGTCLTTCGSLHDQVVDLVSEESPEWSESATGIPPGVRPTL
ncbi:MAG: histidinol-phosphatase [Actinomycetota bacterium]|nr:histidinol-phosphatase [Actinomycetota bacterium]